MESGFLSNQAEYCCAEDFLRDPENPFRLFWEQGNIFGATGSVRFGQRLESLSRYPNQIIFFLFAINVQYQLPDLIKP